MQWNNAFRKMKYFNNMDDLENITLREIVRQKVIENHDFTHM